MKLLFLVGLENFPLNPQLPAEALDIRLQGGIGLLSVDVRLGCCYGEYYFRRRAGRIRRLRLPRI